MTKKLILGLVLACFDQKLVPKKFFHGFYLLDVRHCCKLSLYAISRKTNEPNLRKWQKKQVPGLTLAPLAQIWTQKSFWWILPQLDVRHCCKLSLHTISRKTNEGFRYQNQHPFWALNYIFHEIKQHNHQ